MHDSNAPTLTRAERDDLRWVATEAIVAAVNTINLTPYGIAADLGRLAEVAQAMAGVGSGVYPGRLTEADAAVLAREAERLEGALLDEITDTCVEPETVQELTPQLERVRRCREALRGWSR